MGSTKSIVYKHAAVAELSQLFCVGVRLLILAVLGLFPSVAGILKQKNLAVLKLGGHLLCLLACDLRIIDKFHFHAKSLFQRGGNRG